jgi:hypothetical protein
VDKEAALRVKEQLQWQIADRSEEGEDDDVLLAPGGPGSLPAHLLAKHASEQRAEGITTRAETADESRLASRLYLVRPGEVQEAAAAYFGSMEDDQSGTPRGITGDLGHIVVLYPRTPRVLGDEQTVPDGAVVVAGDAALAAAGKVAQTGEEWQRYLQNSRLPIRWMGEDEARRLFATPPDGPGAEEQPDTEGMMPFAELGYKIRVLMWSRAARSRVRESTGVNVASPLGLAVRLAVYAVANAGGPDQGEADASGSAEPPQWHAWLSVETGNEADWAQAALLAPVLHSLPSLMSVDVDERGGHREILALARLLAGPPLSPHDSDARERRLHLLLDLDEEMGAASAMLHRLGLATDMARMELFFPTSLFLNAALERGRGALPKRDRRRWDAVLQAGGDTSVAWLLPGDGQSWMAELDTAQLREMLLALDAPLHLLAAWCRALVAPAADARHGALHETHLLLATFIDLNKAKSNRGKLEYNHRFLQGVVGRAYVEMARGALVEAKSSFLSRLPQGGDEPMTVAVEHAHMAMAAMNHDGQAAAGLAPVHSNATRHLTEYAGYELRRTLREACLAALATAPWRASPGGVSSGRTVRPAVAYHALGGSAAEGGRGKAKAKQANAIAMLSNAPAGAPDSAVDAALLPGGEEDEDDEEDEEDEEEEGLPETPAAAGRGAAGSCDGTLDSPAGPDAAAQFIAVDDPARAGIELIQHARKASRGDCVKVKCGDDEVVVMMPLSAWQHNHQQRATPGAPSSTTKESAKDSADELFHNIDNFVREREQEDRRLPHTALNALKELKAAMESLRKHYTA